MKFLYERRFTLSVMDFTTMPSAKSSASNVRFSVTINSPTEAVSVTLPNKKKGSFSGSMTQYVGT